MFTPALLLLITLAGPADTVRAVPDSAPTAIPSRLELPVSLQLEADTTPRPRRKSIEVSEWYERRLRIHRYGAYATIPLFVFQAAAGWVPEARQAIDEIALFVQSLADGTIEAPAARPANKPAAPERVPPASR